mmetsp:Transcript_45060/g.73429  ORF Transcript_45060/g.73429 Transcript_45060/m.73429 type:complete len:479 (+) Transcript_45060:1-1437(+)
MTMILTESSVELATVLANPEGWLLNVVDLALVRRLGSGNFGDVYLGRFKSALDVVIKVLEPWPFKLPDKQSTIDLWRGPAMELRSLRHANLVRFIGVCIEGGKTMLVSEFAPEGPLAESLPLIDIGERKRIAIEVVSALRFLESKKMFSQYSLLKLDNVYISTETTGRVTPKLSDFGIYPILNEYYRKPSIISQPEQQLHSLKVSPTLTSIASDDATTPRSAMNDEQPGIVEEESIAHEVTPEVDILSYTGKIKPEIIKIDDSATQNMTTSETSQTTTQDVTPETEIPYTKPSVADGESGSMLQHLNTEAPAVSVSPSTDPPTPLSQGRCSGRVRFKLLSVLARTNAPELLRGDVKEANEKTMMYALGVLLFEVISGLPPWSSISSDTDVTQKVTANCPMEVSAISDRSLRELVQKLLHPLADERPDLRATEHWLINGAAPPKFRLWPPNLFVVLGIVGAVAGLAVAGSRAMKQQKGR